MTDVTRKYILGVVLVSTKLLLMIVISIIFCFISAKLQKIFVTLHCQFIEMFGPHIAERGLHAAVGVMIDETALFANAARLAVAVIITAPQGVEPKFLERMADQGDHRLRNQTLTPIRFADPVSDLALARLYSGRVQSIGEHDPAAADRFSRRFRDHGIRLGSGEDRPYDFKTVPGRGVRRLAGGGADGGIAGVSE